MRNGSIGRTARRSVVVAAVGWLTALGASVLVAPSASAAPSATVAIRDLTPPVVSVDAGGSVTFVNQLQDKALKVGGTGGLLPATPDVTVHTDVTLRLPSGTTPLPVGASVTETFAQSCLTCTVTYAYRMDGGSALTSAVTDAATAMLPALPLPTPFVVNTLVPLPNLPSVNLPQLPQVNVPVPSQAAVPVPAPAPAPAVEQPQAPADTLAPAAAPTLPSVGGSTYSYGTPTGAAQLSPAGDAGRAFDATRSAVPGRDTLGTAAGHGSDSGSGGGARGDRGGGGAPLGPPGRPGPPPGRGAAGPPRAPPAPPGGGGG